MLTEKVTCDVCGVEKKDVNHWWIMETDVDHAHASNPRAVGLSIHPWTWELSRLPDVKHLCGQQCVHSAVDKFLAGKESEVVA